VHLLPPGSHIFAELGRRSFNHRYHNLSTPPSSSPKPIPEKISPPLPPREYPCLPAGTGHLRSDNSVGAWNNFSSLPGYKYNRRKEKERKKKKKGKRRKRGGDLCRRDGGRWGIK